MSLPLTGEVRTCKCGRVYNRLTGPVCCARCHNEFLPEHFAGHLKFCRPADMKRNGLEPNQTGHLTSGGLIGGGNW